MVGSVVVFMVPVGARIIEKDSHCFLESGINKTKL